MAYTLSIGSISSGTMRTEDLLDAFSWELEQIVKRADAGDDVSAAKDLLAEYAMLLDRMDEGEEEDEGDAELVDDMIDVLNEHCPPYCYFGSHDGDCADYGCWVSFDWLEELPHVDDPSDLDGLEDDEAVFVNDHGNVTLYARNEAGEWASVWAIV